MPLDEKSLIARIGRAVPHRHAALRIGMGDDAAVIRHRAENLVVSCDAFLEGVHFLPDVHSPRSVGYKSLARATSDLAAMGVPSNTARFFLLTLALPREKCGRWLDEFLRGLARAARELRMTLAGGDVSLDKRVAISVTVFAESKGRLVTRDGARAGDGLYVSGQLGAAQAGLELLTRDGGALRRAAAKAVLQRHLYPRIRMQMGGWLARQRLASAMIDTSDGLSTDLRNLCDASGVGARIYREALPVMKMPRGARSTALRRALDGGEDYELLFTVPARLTKKVPVKYRGIAITRIGEIVRGKKISLIGERGKATELRARGWDPFR